MYPDLWKFVKNEKFNPIQWQPGPEVCITFNDDFWLNRLQCGTKSRLKKKRQDMDDWSQFPLRQDLLTQSVDKSSSWLDKEQMLDNCSYLVSSYLGQDHYGGILLR